ncbi:MAG: hypothetical protein GXO10_01610 [Crenarchaeota archaeon]|nr:hypothetical protein [Thermoproteota archaeon]
MKILEQTWRGVLGLCDEYKPYLIPVAHIFVNDSLYFFFSRFGRKIEIIRRNPHACYLTSIENVNEVVTVLVEGILEHLEDLETMRRIVKIFVENIFPRDPYFTYLRNLSVDEIVEKCINRTMPGIYRLNITDLSGLLVRRT